MAALLVRHASCWVCLPANCTNASPAVRVAMYRNHSAALQTHLFNITPPLMTLKSQEMESYYTDDQRCVMQNSTDLHRNALETNALVEKCREFPSCTDATTSPYEHGFMIIHEAATEVCCTRDVPFAKRGFDKTYPGFVGPSAKSIETFLDRLSERNRYVPTSR